MIARSRFLVVALLAAVLVSGCGRGDDPVAEPDPPPASEDAEQPVEDPDPDPAAPGEQPEDPDGDPPAPDAAGEGASHVVVYFARMDDSGVWVEPEVHELEEPTSGVARAAIEMLLTGRPHDDELTNAVPDGVDLLGVTVRERVLVVDLSAGIAAHGAGSAQEIAFAEQLAHTAAEFPTVDAVRLWVDGSPVTELWGHLDWSVAIEPDPYTVSPITVTAPAAGPDPPVVARGQVTFRGEARVFEATFGLRLYDAAGTLLVEDFVMASEGAPGRGTWSHRVQLPDPGAYVLEVEEDDPSDGEGRPSFTMRREFEVQ